LLFPLLSSVVMPAALGRSIPTPSFPPVLAEIHLFLGRHTGRVLQAKNEGQGNMACLEHQLSLLSKRFSVNAGFRPGSRGPFVSAKGPKTISVGSRSRWGSFVPGQMKMANNSLRSNRFAGEPDLARDSAAPKAGILSSVVIPDLHNRESFFCMVSYLRL